MSSVAVQKIADERATLNLVVANPAPQVYEETEQWDPLLPVVVAMAVSLAVSVTFIGAILAWLALRHSGVMAP
jgi:hypothetical protein